MNKTGWMVHGPHMHLGVSVISSHDKNGSGVSLLQKKKTSSSDRKATGTNRIHSNYLEAYGMKCCYFWFHSKSNSWRVFFFCHHFGLSNFAVFQCNFNRFLCGKVFNLHLFRVRIFNDKAFFLPHGLKTFWSIVQLSHFYKNMY